MTPRNRSRQHRPLSVSDSLKRLKFRFSSQLGQASRSHLPRLLALTIRVLAIGTLIFAVFAPTIVTV